MAASSTLIATKEPQMQVPYPPMGFRKGSRRAEKVRGWDERQEGSQVR